MYNKHSYIILFLFLLSSFIAKSQTPSMVSDTVCFGAETTLSIENPEVGSVYYWDLNYDGFYETTGEIVRENFSVAGDNSFSVLKKTNDVVKWRSDELTAHVYSVPNISLVTVLTCSGFEVKELSDSWEVNEWYLDGELIQSNAAELIVDTTSSSYELLIKERKNGCEVSEVRNISVLEKNIPVINHVNEVCLRDSIDRKSVVRERVFRLV